MELNKFIANFAGQLENTDPAAITAATVYRDLEEWSSLTALNIIAMVDEQYGVKIKGDDMRSGRTVEGLWRIVESKKA